MSRENGAVRLELELPAEAVAAIAERAAQIAIERLDAATPPTTWLTVKEAAEVLRCDPQRIFDLRSSGRLTRYREGGRALVDRDELDGLVVDDDSEKGRRHGLA